MDSLKEIWICVLNEMKKEVAQVAFGLWIEPIKLVSFDNGIITLECENEFKKKIVRENEYATKFQKIFNEILGFEVEIVYTCPEEILSDSSSEKEKKSQPDEFRNNYYTFDNFIVGPSNRFAYAAAKAVASDPGGRLNSENNYNPLFIYGPSGLGKTHILKAICYEVEKNFPAMNVLYISSEDYTNEFINAVTTKRTEEFRNKYRNNIDVILIDDIQFIATKQSTEEEFFHMFNTFVENGKQVVLTSDRPPKEIQSLEERLKTRFEWGILADVQPPEYETRCAIIKKRAEYLNFEIPDDVVSYIADKIKANIRQLEGMVNKLQALTNMTGQKPTLSMAQKVIKDVVELSQPLPITVKRIVDEVSRTTGVTIEEIYDKRQTARISRTRKICFYIIREVTNMSYENIGAEFKKHHSTVMTSIKDIEKLMKTDSKLARQINDIITNIKDETN